MRLPKITLFIFSLVLLANAQAESTQNHFFKNFHIINGDTNLELDKRRILVYIDETNELEFLEIRNLSQSQYIQSDLINRFNDNSTYWIYYKIENTSEQSLSHLLRGGENSKETYFIVKDSTVAEYKTGYRFPVNDRQIAQGHSTKIKLDHSPKSVVHIYVKIENVDGNPIDIRASIEPYDEWSNFKERVNLFEGVFSGLLIVIIIVDFFLYGYTKQQAFIYFAVYSLINLIYFLHIYGVLEIWIYPNSADPFPILWFFPVLAGAAYFAFARAFLELKETHPFWHKALLTASYSCLALFIFLAIYVSFTDDMSLPTTILFYFLMAVSVMGIAFLYAINIKGNLIIRYFTFGTLLLLVFVFLASITEITGDLVNVPIYVQIGLIIELIVFCLGVSHKLKKDFENHEITQRSLILQLKNNEKLQLNINQELTELVAARTQVIKKQNKALEIARNEAEKATNAKSEFLSVMSHEIRTPLNAIISLTHIMEMDNENEEMQEYIDALKFSAEGLHSLINDVLDYNKIEADRLTLESIEFSIIDLLKNIRDSFKYKAKSQGIDLLIEIGEHMPDRVMGDPTRLTQIFNNLIGNAIKFTHFGHVHIKASLDGLKDDIATVNFEVNDTGIGIPKDKLVAIFEEYEQAGKETTREYGGTGLGLSITQKLLKLMGSHVNIDSAEEEGTSLSFAISFRINQAFDVISLQEEMRDKDLMQKAVLVVDDNDMNRLVLKRLLHNWNAIFVEASNGESALELCQQKQFDLILMDIEMKPISGFEAAQKIRESCDLNADTPLVAMSGYLASEFDTTIDSSLFSTLVQKPFEPNELYRQLIKQIKF